MMLMPLTTKHNFVKKDFSFELTNLPTIPIKQEWDFISARQP